MNLFSRFIYLLISLGLYSGVLAQVKPSTDYLQQIKQHDASTLWYTTSNQEETDTTGVVIPEPLGFIGANYQRFYIHYTAVAKCKTNPCQYDVLGKTKVNGNVCNFSGALTIVKAGIYKQQFDYRFKQGFIECKIEFKEDSSQPATGTISGKLVSEFYLDEQQLLQIDDLMFGADGYRNNQCQAKWTSYTTHKSKAVNWGDYRIPRSKMLDTGDGEFVPAKQYLQNAGSDIKRQLPAIRKILLLKRPLKQKQKSGGNEITR